MKAIWHGHVIAESDQTIEAEGYQYFPRESVQMNLLHLAPRTINDRACPDGVQFYDLAEKCVRSYRAAWSFEAPHGSMEQVDQWVGFWKDVEIVGTRPSSSGADALSR